MGWRLTMFITREDALKELLPRLLEMPNDELAEMLEKFSTTRKFHIVSDYENIDRDDRYCKDRSI
jgi:hypothetical protein